MGCGCGSFGRAVASKSRGPRFESSHSAKCVLIYFKSQQVWKKIKRRKWYWRLHLKSSQCTQNQRISEQNCSHKKCYQIELLGPLLIGPKSFQLDFSFSKKCRKVSQESWMDLFSVLRNLLNPSLAFTKVPSRGSLALISFSLHWRL